jgi:YD repeat-containing protein
VYALIGSVFLGWLTGGCTRQEQTTAPQGTCRIQQYKATTTAAAFNSTRQANYQYDQQGNLTNVVTTLDQRPTAGTIGTQTGTTTIAYTYDAAGYVTASSSRQQTTDILADNKTNTGLVSITTSYSYTNGRLSTAIINNISAYGLTTNTTESYQYDAAGNLIRKTALSTYTYDPAITKEIPGSPTGPLRTWTYQNNQLVDYVEQSGTAEVRPITIVNGLVTSYSTTGNYKTIWEYDRQNRQTKTADYIGDTLRTMTTQNWSDAKPATASLPPFKGFPVTVPASEFGQAGVVSTYTNSYWNDVSKKIETFMDRSSVSQTNGQGFVTNTITTAKHPNPAATPQDYTTTETYTYSNCQ